MTTLRDKSGNVIEKVNPLPVELFGIEEANPLPVKTIPTSKVPIGSQTGLSVTATAIGLDVPTGAVAASIQVFTAAIRFWPDGRIPTATTGHRADVYDIIELETPEEVRAFLGIREAGTSATLEITYYRALL